MERLSEAGQLYLKDYQVLNEAQNDAFNFLNTINAHVDKNLAERIRELPTLDGKLGWRKWNNQSNLGYLEVEPVVKTDHMCFRKGKADLYLQCMDIKHDTEKDDPCSITVQVRGKLGFLRSSKKASPATLSAALEAASDMAMPLDLSSYVLYRSEVPINPKSAFDSAETVTEVLLDMCQAVAAFIDIFLKEPII